MGIVTADTGMKVLTCLRESSVKLLPSEAERELLVRKDPDMAGRCTQSHGEAVPPQLTNSRDADSDLRCCKRSIPTPESRLKDKLKLYTAKSQLREEMMKRNSRTRTKTSTPQSPPHTAVVDVGVEYAEASTTR